MVFHDFPALARVARGATSIPTDPRVTVIVDDNSGNVIYSGLSWAHGIMTPIPTRTPVRTPTPLPSGITGATPIPTGGGQLHPPQLTTVAPQPASPQNAANPLVGASSAVWAPEPGSIQTLVNRSDAIVIGRIDSILAERIEGPYGASENTDQRDVPQPAEYPYTYYSIAPDVVVLDDGLVRDNLVIKLKGFKSKRGSSPLRISLPDVGDEFVFFLSRNPDDKSYSFLGPWALVDVSGPTVVQYGGARPEPTFAPDANPASFAAMVALAAHDRVPASPLGDTNLLVDE